MTDAHLDQDGELIAGVELAREVQPCPRYGFCELRRVHDRRTHTVGHLPAAGQATETAVAQAIARLLGGLRHLRGADRVDRTSLMWSAVGVATSEANIPIDTIRKAFGVV